MVGRRVDFVLGWPGRIARPGDYCKVPAGIDPRGEGLWYMVAPNGDLAAFGPRTHRFTEHADGTISAAPSLVFPAGWHGFLTAGVWSG